MLKSMKVKCFILFFAVFFTNGKTDIDFVDCGSELYIRSVQVTNCTEVPCIFSPGDNITVEVDLRPVSQLTNSEFRTEAYISMFGQRWALTVTPINPCTQWWTCPLASINNLTYVGVIHLEEDLIRRPGEVVLQSSYVDGGENIMAVCVQFNVNLQ